MVRATRLVSALRLGLPELLGPQAPLLVVGGGAAGVAAAMVANSLGVPTVLVEQEGHVLSRQWGVSTRWLDPTEYDFPQPHWKEPVWPPAGGPSEPPLPLAFPPASASRLASRWDRDWNLALRRARAAEARGGPPLVALTDHGPLAASDLRFQDDGIDWVNPDPRSTIRRFGAVVSCVGMGLEQTSGTTSSAFRGVPFWRTDSLCNRGLGLGDVGAINVLVSGGGDGAQQDIQRILCADFGRRLAERLGEPWTAVLDGLVGSGDLLAADLRRIDARRGGLAEEIVQADFDWEKCYAEAAQAAWLARPVHQRHEAMRALLRPETDDAPIHLTWLLREGQPSFSYGLNRLLTEWVLLAYQLSNGRTLRGKQPARMTREHPIILSGWQLNRLAPADGHTCNLVQAPYSCTPLPHFITVEPVAGGAPRDLGRFDAVVVRHGLVPAALFGGSAQGQTHMPFDWLQTERTPIA